MELPQEHSRALIFHNFRRW